MPVEIDVLKALSSMSYLLAYKERITMDPNLASANSVDEGQQVRVKVLDATTKYGIYTVHQFYEDGVDNDDIRMALAARQRLDQTEGFDAYLEGCDQVVVHGQTDAQLQTNNDFGEFLDESDTEHTGLVICAPHGGSIESFTDDMALRCYNHADLAEKGRSCWRCIGYQSAVGAFDAWHITSSEISRLSFPYLDQIGDRGFSYAVSFHGYGEADIAIGGLADSSLKNAIKTAIESVVGEGYEVTLATSGSYAGVDPDNFINWLTDANDRSIQLEIPYDVRAGYGNAIADAVAEVFAALL